MIRFRSERSTIMHVLSLNVFFFFLQEVEAIFKSVNCPRVLSIEFAHNSNWYITFQSDMDALQVH